MREKAPGEGCVSPGAHVVNDADYQLAAEFALRCRD